ncbi:MAG: nucleotide exchange factor GrpE [Myxococcota bacterium]
MGEHAGDKPGNGQGMGDNEDDVIFPEESDAEEAGEATAEGEAQGSANAGEPEESAADKALAERDRMREQLLRIAADFDNFRKRSRKEIEEVRRRSVEDTLREVLPVIDNLERAADAMDGAKDVTAVAEGVHMVLRGFEEVAARLGLKRVKAMGELFDPTLHDAMQQQETNEHPPGTIVAEVVPGYELGERLLRPAMVVVARPEAGTGDQGSDDDEPSGVTSGDSEE